MGVFSFLFQALSPLKSLKKPFISRLEVHHLLGRLSKRYDIDKKPMVCGTRK